MCEILTIFAWVGGGITALYLISAAIAWALEGYQSPIDQQGDQNDASSE